MAKRQQEQGVLGELFKTMYSSDDLNPEKILNSLITKDKNLVLKTQIENPEALAVLSLLAEYLRKINYDFSATIILYYIDRLMENWVSKGRMSRKEIIEGLKGLVQYARETQEKEGMFRRY